MIINAEVKKELEVESLSNGERFVVENSRMEYRDKLLVKLVQNKNTKIRHPCR